MRLKKFWDLKFWNSFPKLIVKPFSTAEGSIFLQSYGLIAIWWKHLEWNKIIANIILFALIRSLFNELTLTIGRISVFDWRSNYWQKPEFPDFNRSWWAILIEHAKYYLKVKLKRVLKMNGPKIFHQCSESELQTDLLNSGRQPFKNSEKCFGISATYMHWNRWSVLECA